MALLLEHGYSAIVGIIGTLRAGCTFIPMDPYQPEARLADIVNDASATVILSQDRHQAQAHRLSLTTATQTALGLEDCLAQCRYDEPQPPLQSSDSWAYILYTSGSTGRPKGVIQSQRNVMHFMKTYAKALNLTPADRLTQFSTYAFDAGLMDIFGSLLTGATLYPYDPKRTGAIENLGDWLRTNRISVYHSVPTLFRYFMHQINPDRVFHNVRLVVMGGEPVLANDAETFKQHFPTHSIFVNGLGPTESTVTLQYFLTHDTEIQTATVPVGFAVEDTEVYLLDSEGKESPIGSPGELVYKSDFLALGYLNQQELTAQSFCQDPWTGSGRIFKTGDLARRLSDGAIEFLGRIDSQIKIRGYRIELNDIESVLDRCEGVLKSVVVPYTPAFGESRLIAYFVPIDETGVSESSALSYLRQRLPTYMLPSRCLVIDEFPLTFTGKIDRSFLLTQFPPELATAHLLPETPVEQAIFEIWSRILGHKRFGVLDHFEAVGGNSLHATSVALDMEEEFDIEIPLLELADRSTIRELSEYISEREGEYK